jgi:hypothetical protein
LRDLELVEADPEAYTLWERDEGVVIVATWKMKSCEKYFARRVCGSTTRLYVEIPKIGRLDRFEYCHFKVRVTRHGTLKHIMR